MEKLRLIEQLLDFIEKSPSSYHAVDNIKSLLTEEGFTELSLRERWNVEKGKKYFSIRNNSSIIAFTVGRGELKRDGFRLIASHTDFPTFKVKPNPEIVSENTYLKLNTEVYGGPILNTWMDRPLSLAGKVIIESKDPFHPESINIDFKKPLLVIPNIAIHLNKSVNDGINLKKQKDMLPLVSLVGEDFKKEDFLTDLISKELDIENEKILDFELNLYEAEKGRVIGCNNELVSSGRLDNMAMVHASISSLLESDIEDSTNVVVCFDNEEVGSSTKQGAASPMLKNALERINLSLGGDKEDFYCALYNSFLISADQAHAVHPNSPEIHDPTNRPVINKGPCIKISASQSYTTDSDSEAVFKHICKKANVPVQTFVNHSDSRGGSTIGPINSTQLDIRSVDIGNPVLSMHSIRELGGVDDNYFIRKAFKEFFKLQCVK